MTFKDTQWVPDVVINGQETKCEIWYYYSYQKIFTWYLKLKKTVDVNVKEAFIF